MTKKIVDLLVKNNYNRDSYNYSRPTYTEEKPLYKFGNSSEF